jgi:hypothetical protein
MTTPSIWSISPRKEMMRSETLGLYLTARFTYKISRAPTPQTSTGYARVTTVGKQTVSQGFSSISQAFHYMWRNFSKLQMLHKSTD